MIYTVEVLENSSTVYSHDVLLEVGYDFGAQVSAALDLYRKNYQKSPFEDGRSIRISKKA